MNCENNSYHKIGEIYFADGKSYSFFCLYCDELFYDFAKFKLHSKIHLNETEIIEKEIISSDIKIELSTINETNLENQTDISYNCLELKERLEIQPSPDSTENNIRAELITDEDFNVDLDDDLSELQYEDLSEHVDEDLEEHIDEIPDEHIDYQNEDSDEMLKDLVKPKIKNEDLAEVYCSFCKLYYELNSHNSEKCSKIQEVIDKCNGDFIKLLKEGILCCLKCRRYFEDYKTLYKHHKQAKHCMYNEKCKICKLYKFMNLKITEKKLTVNQNDEENQKEIEDQIEDDYEDDSYVDLFDDSISIKNKEYPFKCSFCEKVFRLKNQMNLHIRVHTNHRPYKCQFCPSAFTVAANLKNHIVYKHTEEKPFVCKYENCNKSFKLMDLKKQHEKRHLPASFQCELCGKYFKARIYLLLHQRNVHEDPENWQFQCEFCQKKFPRKARLTEHTRMHTGEKPYRCDICQKFFSKGSTLRQHKRIHSDEKDYICRFCGKAFKQSAGYWGHMKRHPDPNKQK